MLCTGKLMTKTPSAGGILVLFYFIFGHAFVDKNFEAADWWKTFTLLHILVLNRSAFGVLAQAIETWSVDHLRS